MKGQPDTTLLSISKQLNISVSTVSRVLNGKWEKYRISKKTADMILQTAKDLNYSPNELARGLRLSRTNTIGLIIPDIANPFFAKISSFVEKSARENGYSVIVSDSEEKTDIEKSSLNTLMSRKIDGIIISPVGEEAEHLIVASQKNIPIVLIDRYFSDISLPYIGTDNFKGALEATNYLIQNGHKKIAFIQGKVNTSVNKERVRGYVEALKLHNLGVSERLIVGDSYGEENGYVETKLLISQKNKPTAIFASSNLISLGALKALEEEGLNVPNDFSLICFDDQPYFDFLSTPMTTVAQPSKEIASIAFKLLIDKVENNKNIEPERILLPTKIVFRKSVKHI